MKYHSVVLTYTGSIYFLNETQAENVCRVGEKDILNVNGCLIKGANISEILTYNEFCRQYPDKIPVSENNYKKLEIPVKMKFKRERYVQALERMIVGFNKVFTDREMPKKSIMVLNRMENKLKEELKLNQEEMVNFSPAQFI